jgi:hypothetical protein
MAKAPLPNPNLAPSNVRRFRTNPVELAIFSIISLIFCHSVYSLIYDHQGFQATALSPMAANPISEGRLPASVSQAFVNFEINCEAKQEQVTEATKARLMGSLCESKAGNTQLIRAAVVNSANKFAATVFTDTTAGKFSTDYIPLNAGPNPIHIEFTYRGGQTVSQDFQIMKQ